MKFLILLQFWDGDKAKAMRLAKFIADLEPCFRTDVDFVFVARFDCEHDHDTIRYVNEKFRVDWITTHTCWTGWPGGPNAMALDTLEWLAANRKDALGALLIEPDCVPLNANWLNILIEDWRVGLEHDRWIMGAWRNSGGAHGHINGNCVVRTDLAKLIPLRDIVGPDLAWDCAIADWVRMNWFVTDRIKNCFDSVNATAKDLFWTEIGMKPHVLVHGFKDSSAYDLACKNLLEPDTTELSL